MSLAVRSSSTDVRTCCAEVPAIERIEFPLALVNILRVVWNMFRVLSHAAICVLLVRSGLLTGTNRERADSDDVDRHIHRDTCRHL